MNRRATTKSERERALQKPTTPVKAPRTAKSDKDLEGGRDDDRAERRDRDPQIR